jgi:hypothetical protein
MAPNENHELPPIEMLSGAICAASNLIMAINVRDTYPYLKDSVLLVKIFRVFQDEIENIIDSDFFESIRLRYNRLDINCEQTPDWLWELFLLTHTSLCEHPGMIAICDRNIIDDAAKKTEILVKAESFVSRSLQGAIRQFREFQIFECRLPNSPSVAEFQSKGRCFFLLQTYWQLIRTWLYYISGAPMGMSPNPLLRFTTNIRARILESLDRLDIPELADMVDNLLSLSVSDIDGMEEYLDREIEKIEEGIENARLQFGTESFELTTQEVMFINTFYRSFDDYKSKIDRVWDATIKKVEKSAQEIRERTIPNFPASCKEYITNVELTLRELINHKYITDLGDDWQDQMRLILDEDRFAEAMKNMKDRHVNGKYDFLHFTNLPDLQTIINKRWPVFQNSFSCRLKEFNKLVAPILKGRTEDAHNRPMHLWPQIERERVRVACHDLLEEIIR